MPELPEVETVRRGLEPILTGATIRQVVLNRPDLRFALPKGFVARLQGQRIEAVSRRAKYLLWSLSGGETLLGHLGMTGNFRFAAPGADGRFEKHDHIVFELAGAAAPSSHLVYSDPRRFGFMDLFAAEADCAFLRDLGPEPLGNQFHADHLAVAFAGRSAPVKSLLLDQRVVAGLGNIYVSEALHLAGIDPRTPGRALVTGSGAPRPPLPRLAAVVRQVLEDAIGSGGSTLQDYRNVDGSTGYFQHRFLVYGHEGEPCRRDGCKGTITRIVQSGRSTFFCPACQSRYRAPAPRKPVDA